MAKFHGRIGFCTMETNPDTGISRLKVVEKPYSGDVLKSTRQFTNGDSVNDDISLRNRISIVADSFAHLNISYMRYAEYMGNLWKITSYDIEYPRIILTLGGVYNGEQA